MTTQTTTYDRRPGWVTFAAVLLFAVCFTRIISAINYFGNGAQINDLTNSAFGQHLWVWGIWDCILALLAGYAGLSLLSGGRFGRVVAYIWAAWAIVQSFMIINLVPAFAIVMMVVAGLVIYGLAMTSGRGTE